MMPTDLQRIELAFPAEAMLHVVDHGANRTRFGREFHRIYVITAEGRRNASISDVRATTA